MAFKDKIYGWQWFRDFFNITIFKYFVTWFAIVPIFAKISESLPKKIHIPVNKELNYTIHLELPFKWEILWFSSLCFVIAYILYLIFRPNFISKYFSLKYYLEFEHSPRWIVWETQKLIKSSTDLDKFVKRMSDKGYLSITNDSKFKDKELIDVGGDQTYLYFLHNNIKYKFAMPIIKEGKEDEGLTKIAVREIFWEIFGRFSSSKFKIRLVIQGLLAISLITFTIAFMQSIYSGFQYFIK
ncbi:hypothetical protein [Flavobacterium lindanitolerans]|jgi:hypothetical protein|uniref:hypothetical protein n=1 Tax=Flavobacterium lindanitolerans TaxID=428988 RepID=UPI0023F54E01|nr:hypothetical protein [Flavobacterium lindanitolerans]